MKLEELREKVQRCAFEGTYERIGFMNDLSGMFMEYHANKKQAMLAADMAWEHGHSAGYSEVLIYASDLIPIFEAGERVG